MNKAEVRRALIAAARDYCRRRGLRFTKAKEKKIRKAVSAYYRALGIQPT